MIQVKIKTEKEQVKNITVSGHAGYGVSGTDIVCAAVSSILITSINAILRIDMDAIQYEEKDGFISVEILKQEQVVQILIENLIDLLTELQNDYQKYIKINKEVSSC